MCLNQLLPKESYMTRGGEETELSFYSFPGLTVKSVPLHLKEKVPTPE